MQEEPHQFPFPPLTLTPLILSDTDQTGALGSFSQPPSIQEVTSESLPKVLGPQEDETLLYPAGGPANPSLSRN